MKSAAPLTLFSIHISRNQIIIYRPAEIGLYLLDRLKFLYLFFLGIHPFVSHK